MQEASLTGSFLFDKRKVDMALAGTGQSIESAPAMSGDITFLFAHPDDESMMFAAAIRRQTALAPQKTRLVAATDGTMSTDGHGDFVQNGGRDTELDDAAKHLEVLPNNINRLGMQDQELHKRRSILRQAWKIGKMCVKQEDPTVCTPGWDGFNEHSDHRATHIAATLAQGGLRLIGKHVTIMAVDKEGTYRYPVDADDKREALLKHGSQYDKELLDGLAQQEPYKTAMTREERYTRQDGSWRDFVRALSFVVGKGLREHVPQPDVSYTTMKETVQT